MRKFKPNIATMRGLIPLLIGLVLLSSSVSGQSKALQKKNTQLPKSSAAVTQQIQNILKAGKLHYSPGGLLDSVFDNTGQRYSLGQIAINNKIRAIANGATNTAPTSGSPSAPTPAYSIVTPATCTSGYFQLYLETGCGMENYATDPVHAARLNVLCQVLNDISGFINSPCSTSGQKINIWVKNYTGLTVPGVGSPFYSIPYSTTKSGIADNAIWITLNSGTDAFTNVATPLSVSGGGSSGSAFFHGSIRFDFSGAINWHTDMTTTPAAGEMDLYTVALHEMMHAMGFGTLIEYDGSSVIGPGYQYYTRYDQHLQTPGGTPLITNTGSCSLYQWEFNPAIPTPTSVLSPGGCGSYSTTLTDHTDCGTALKYVGATTVPVYTPTCFERGSSLSHFEDECYTPPSWFTTLYPLSGYNNQYFTMSNAGTLGAFSSTNPGCMKRYLKPEERLALCDIGYNVNTTFGGPSSMSYPNGIYLNYYDYGGTACPGINVAGINDGIASGTFSYTTTPSVMIPIPISSVISNDHNATDVTCVDVVTGGGSATVVGSDIQYTPASSDFGVELLRYIPKNTTTGVTGNITYIYVYVGDPDCTPTPCDLVANGGFENVNTSAPDWGEYLYGRAHCWGDYNEDAALLSTTATTAMCEIPNTFWFSTATYPHPFSSGPNTHFVSMAEGPYTGGLWVGESIQQQLSTSLMPGQTYTVSFWAKLGDAYGWSTQPTHLQFWISNTYPLIGSTYPFSSATPSGVSSLYEFTISQPDNAWHYYTVTVPYTLASPSSALIVQPAPWDDVPTASKAIAIDDISIVPAPLSCTFTLPPMCSTDPTYDLTTAVSVPGGTFQWFADGGGGTVVTSTSSTFDPASAYTASISSGGSGIVTVAYTYTDGAGCTRTVYAETHIYPSAPITGPTTVCIGSTITLSDAVSGGTWSTSDATIASVTSTGDVTGASSGTVTITYTEPGGCIQTYHVTVITPPVAACACAYIAGGTPFTELSGSITSSPAPGNYYVNTSLVIPTGYTINFTNCVVLMAAGTSITVQSGAKLVLAHSHFFSCHSDMWQGFILSNLTGTGSSWPTGQLELNHDNLIEDAKVAIDIPAPISMTSYDPTVAIPDYLTLYSHGAIFNENAIGIRISAYAPIMTVGPTGDFHPSYPFVVQNSIFTCRDFTSYISLGGVVWPFAWPGTLGSSDALKAAITPATPYDPPYNITTYTPTVCHSSLLSQNAITLDKVGATSGTLGSALYSGMVVGGPYPADPSDVNIFDNMNDGISAHNSNLVVRNSEFMNMHVTSGSGAGDGIHSYEDNFALYKLYIYGNPSGYNDKFWDCVTGVEASELYNVTGIYAVMSSKQSTMEPSYPQGKYGYKTSSSNFYETQINFNTIYNISNGIDNTITVPPVGGTLLIGQSTIYRNYISAANPWGSPATLGEYVKQAISLQNATGPIYGNFIGGTEENVDNNLLGNVYNGIYVTYCGEANTPMTTIQNYITMVQDPSLTPGSPNQTGIKHLNNILDYISDNNIIGPGYATPVPPSVSSSPYNTSPLIEGIHVEDNRDLWVQCNNVSEINTGFFFGGTNAGTSWINNIMQDNSYGFVLDGYIGPQPGTGSNVTGNQWLPSGFWTGTNYQTYTMGSGSPSSSPMVVTGPGGVEDPINNGSEAPAVPYVTGSTIIETSYPYTSCETPTSSVVPIEMLAKHALGTSSIQDNTTSLTIFPNPNKGTFTISGTISGVANFRKVKLEVIDMLGKVLYTDFTIVQDNKINKTILLDQSISSGMYSIRVISDKQTNVFKFTIDK